MKSVAFAQEAFLNDALVDKDEDGIGEYAFLAELAGALVYGVDPPLLPKRFGEAGLAGVPQCAGYSIRVWLPARKGGGVLEEFPPTTSQRSQVDSDASEQLWCAYAWPRSLKQGRRVFFVDQTRRVRQLLNTEGTYHGLQEPSLEVALTREEREAWGLANSERTEEWTVTPN